MLRLSKQRYVAAYDVALIYASLASTQMSFLAQDPMFDAVHADPRFASPVQRMGIYRRPERR